jgi:ketosteroid isomerase-like protein
MSERNVELVRIMYARFARGLELSPALFTADFELDGTDVSVEGGVVRGIEAANSALQPYHETFDGFHVEMEEVIYADDEHVVCVVRDGGRIPGSEAELSNLFFNVFTFRDRRIRRLSFHTDRNRALAAAGRLE